MSSLILKPRDHMTRVQLMTSFAFEILALAKIRRCFED
jgi:hypothetical protein